MNISTFLFRVTFGKIIIIIIIGPSIIFYNKYKFGFSETEDLRIDALVYQ